MKSFKEIAELMKVLSDKTRLMILSMLKEQEMCVCEIVEVLQTTQPNVSQHLRRLKSAGLVKETRRSQWVYYSLHVEDKAYLNDILALLPTMQEEIAGLNPDHCKMTAAEMGRVRQNG